MNERSSRKPNLWLPLLFALVMVLGMVIGFRLKESQVSKRDINSVIDKIGDQYVDTVNKDKLYDYAVEGILKHLDPHSVFIPADELEGVNEDLEGSFFGIGVEFTIMHDTLHATSVIENGPAEKAGIDAGDKFIKIGDSIIAGNKTSTEKIIRMLRGPEHSPVSITIKDALSGTVKTVTVNRGSIPLYSVDAGIMLDNTTGYIKINRFAQTTFDEFMTALKRLRAEGMQQLVLDLRDNPGGYLDQASKIADQLLSEDKMVVYTEGVHSKREEYKTKEPGLFERGKLVVLVDESSASASEILAGALQDWDRAVIVGRRSYGKGLVQQQFELQDHSAIRLTVARYFTPSGRSIQRSYAKGNAAYSEDLADRLKTGELTGTDSLTHQDTTKYYTAAHRVVYGGGGIRPDVLVPYDTALIPPALLTMAFSDELKDILWDYFIAHKKELRNYKTLPAFDQGFTATDELIGKYLNSLGAIEKNAAEQLLQNPVRRDYLRGLVKAQMAKTLFRNAGFYSIQCRQDRVVSKAMELIRGDGYSKIIGR